jgi:hypothetical protein
MKKYMKMTDDIKIAMLIPVCSRYQTYTKLEDCPFFRVFLPNFNRTKELKGYKYKIFMGYDDDDTFYKGHCEIIKKLADIDTDIVMLTNCQHHPVKAWNELFERALKEGYEYHFQIGDDVGLETVGWTVRFVEHLKSQNNIGTIAPCEPMNYWGRKQAGKRIVNETNFVHKTHYDIFGYFFYPDIRNWYCDDWITFVYGDKYAHMDTKILCTNEVKGQRYCIIECPKIETYVKYGQEKLKTYLTERNLKEGI